MSDLRKESMKEISKRNKTINYSSLKRTQFAENYALTLQELYTDIASVPTSMMRSNARRLGSRFFILIQKKN